MAYVDTEGRVPIVTREGDLFRIEYAAARYAIADSQRAPPESAERRRGLVKRFEKFGFHRALRLAGARPGDRVRVGALEVELWEYPEPHLPVETDGIAGYEYVVARPIGRRSNTDLEAEARRVAPLLVAKLLTA